MLPAQAGLLTDAVAIWLYTFGDKSVDAEINPPARAVIKAGWNCVNRKIPWPFKKARRDNHQASANCRIVDLARQASEAEQCMVRLYTAIEGVRSMAQILPRKSGVSFQG